MERVQQQQQQQESVIFDINLSEESQEYKDRKRIEVEQKLQGMQQQRMQQKQEKLDEIIKEKDPDEDINKIDLKFNQTIEEIRSQLPQWKDIGDDKATQEKFFEGIFAKFKDLREYIATFAYSLPSYLLQTQQQQLDTLNELINKEKDLALPKKKFTFNRGKQQDKPKAKAEEVKPQEEQKIVRNTLGNDLVIRDVYHQTIRKTEAEYEGKENIIIENIENCEIYLPFKIKSLYFKNLTDTKVFVGCVSGASFINLAKNCKFHMASHQIRIHNSEKTDFYLIAKSNPIIEHCKEMKFGVYNCDYANLEEHLKDAQLYQIKNFYNQVLDFNWLKQDKSPNWDIIEESESAAKIKID